MCDSCLIEGQPTMAFSVVQGVAFTFSPNLNRMTALVKQSAPVRLCLPCFRVALKSYKAATVAFPAPQPPEGMTDAPRAFKGQQSTINQSILSTIN